MKKHLKWVAVALLALPLNPVVAFGVGRWTANDDLPHLEEDEYVNFNGDVVHVDDIHADS